ncbi:MAG: hypothetical protein WCD76_19085, partial [Pyrinomonadaceae bacterium]
PVLGAATEVENLFYATGFYRNGILLAPAAGEIVADIVLGGAASTRADTLAAFSPARLARARTKEVA